MKKYLVIYTNGEAITFEEKDLIDLHYKLMVSEHLDNIISITVIS